MSIIIDTDPGIDDAIAILYALCSGQDVAAITTVGGNIGLTATTRNAGRIIALAGASVPVHPGAARTIDGGEGRKSGVHGPDGLGGTTFPEPATPPDPRGALDAMERLLTEAPARSITLFCLGPLTNLARLLASAPDAAARLGPVIAMGGAVDEPGNVSPTAEFNFAHDPIAAEHVLTAGLDLTLIPLDATRKFRADKTYIAALRAADTPQARATADLIEAYFAATTGHESRPLHDPCVPLLYRCPEAFRIETRALEVELSTGALVPGPNRVRVALGLDAEALRAELLRGLSGPPA